jgi:hypothetical protein
MPVILGNPAAVREIPFISSHLSGPQCGAFSVAEMVDLKLYKVDSYEDDDHAFDRLLSQLRTFADHCRAVVRQDLGLIITLY